MLTICTATYNALSRIGEKALTDGIASVRAIPYPHEHLVVDGASTDGTCAVLARAAAEDPLFRFVSERDGGIFDAIAKGLFLARGEYFYVLGADDLIREPVVMADVARGAEARGDDIVISPVWNGDRLMPKKRSLMKKCLIYSQCSHQGEIARTALLRAVGGFDLRYRCCADYKQRLLAVLGGARVRYDNRPYAYYAPGGFSTDHVADCVRDCHNITAEVFSLTPGERDVFERRKSLPLRVTAPLLFRRSGFLRRAALFAVRREAWRIVKAGVGIGRLRADERTEVR